MGEAEALARLAIALEPAADGFGHAAEHRLERRGHAHAVLPAPPNRPAAEAGLVVPGVARETRRQRPAPRMLVHARRDLAQAFEGRQQLILRRFVAAHELGHDGVARIAE